MTSFRERALLGIVSRSWRLARALSFHVHTEEAGRGFIIPVYRGVGIDNLKDTERWLRPVIRRAIGSSDAAFVDVGANIGQALLSLSRVNREIPYVGFEPNPQSCAYLESLIRVNGLTRHIVVPIGAFDERGARRLNLGSETDVCASVISDFRPRDFFDSSIFVWLERGDSVLSELGVERVGMIKIDVEGAELEGIRGLASAIERDRPCLVVEVLGHRHLLDSAVFERASSEQRDRIVAFRRGRTQQLEALLGQLRYETFLMHPDGTWTACDGLDPADAPPERNFLAVPAERRAEYD